MQPIADIRKDYKLRSLDESDTRDNPIDQFGVWWQEAVDSQINEVNAMALATATADGKPDARIVLLKDYSDKGFVFFTNYESRKGQELAENPYASIVFFWKELERQVRITGSVEKLGEEGSDAYFASRPLGSRIGAWASPQSRVIKSRDILQSAVENLEKIYGNGDIPRPGHWGGYVVVPTAIEFWQGRSSRLHDRIRYQAGDNGSWKKERLAP